MRKVRLFSDWEESAQLAIDVISRCTTSNNFKFGDVQLVWDDSYSHVVVCNFALEGIPSDFPADRILGFVFEPVEILDLMYQGWRDFDPSIYGGYYSFANDMGPSYQSALGITLPSVECGLDAPDWNSRNTACMIVSDKTYTPYQVKRREVMRLLMESDLDIDFYGRNMDASSDVRVMGEIPPGGKAEVLSQYKYVIDFENCLTGLTDKFHDAVLCGAVPITNSTAPQLLGLNGEGHHWVNFEKPATEIVKTVAWFLRPHMGKEPSATLSSEVASGRLNFANWINQKVKELP